jgi:hypothetical protein
VIHLFNSPPCLIYSLEVIKTLGYQSPTPIQGQAVPAIMSGRDVIGVAKTGSGKTLAFLLPMFRHIKDQRPLDALEGPIAMIMTPTRELATQIYKEGRPFLKSLGLRVSGCFIERVVFVISSRFPVIFHKCIFSFQEFVYIDFRRHTASPSPPLYNLSVSSLPFDEAEGARQF